MHIVDQSRAEILPDGGNTAEKLDVIAIGSFGGALQGSVNTMGDEVVGGAAVHDDRRPGVVSEHEDWGMVGRVIAPPPLPAVVGPRSADRPEHVASHDPRSDVSEPARREVVIDACRATLLSGHLLKRSGGDKPRVQRFAANTERIVGILLGAGAVAVQGDDEVVNAKLGHAGVLPFWSNRSSRLRRQDRA